MKRLRDELAEVQQAAIRKSLGMSEEATIPQPPGQSESPSLPRSRWTQRQIEDEARRTRHRAQQERLAKARRVPTFDERVRFHEAQEREASADLTAVRASRARDDARIMDVVRLLTKTATEPTTETLEDGSTITYHAETVDVDAVGLAVGVTTEAVEKCLERYWG